MNENQLIIIPGSNTLAWHVPLPTWPSMKLGSQPLRRTYTFSNQSSREIRITAIYFDVSQQDDRVGFAGGTAYVGLALAPQASCSIDVQISPKRLGTGEQVLNIEHSGDYSPLWTELTYAVVATTDTRTSRSYFSEDTPALDRQRRLMEQDGHRHYARVNARSHPEQTSQQHLALSEGAQNNILQNPWLNSQRYDGIDPNLNPEPPLNSEARREFDNERREQEMEKQLRLGNMPRPSAAPKPQGF